MALNNVIKNFLKLESSSGILLLFSGLLALFLSNSNIAENFDYILHLKLNFGSDSPLFYKSIQHWINDGLMVIFFFVVGLEIKREFQEGELSMPSQAILPVIAAIGGMAVPAIFYLLFNFDDPSTIQGWAIPSATDIAFSLGILSLLGKKVPISLKIFLTALAIIDDLGAIIIIAVFYSSNIDLFSLFVVFIILFFLYFFNKKNIQLLWVYIILGILLWVFIQNTGIHATIAGVLLAAFIPHKKQNGQKSLLIFLEHSLHPWVSYLIMPLFALANAGVYLGDVSFNTLISPIPLGIITGLFFGKQLGVFFISFILIKMGYARLPSGANWMQLYGVAILTGVGFTMSLFIGNLAFLSDTHISGMKLGVLVGSFFSAIMGYFILKISVKNSKNK